MLKKRIDGACAHRDTHLPSFKLITLVITDEDAAKAQRKASLDVKLCIVQSGPIFVADISILQEEVRSLNVLIGPLFVTQLFLEIVGVKHDSCSEEVRQVFWLTFLSWNKVIGEKPHVFLNH